MKIELNNYLLFRMFLQDDLISRIRRNPSYSLRSYAKSLKINDSTLSKILSGKLKITEPRFKSLCEGLSLTEKEIKSFDESELNPISEGQLKIMSDWYYFAILELIKTKTFRYDITWIANRLSLLPDEVESAINDLITLKFIEFDNQGNLKLCFLNNKWNGDNSNQMMIAHRRLQEGILRKSISCLHQIPPNEKENSSLTVACNRSLLPEIKDKIKKFKRELDQFIINNGKHEDVYQLSVSFFPLTSEPSEN